jgi:uncharacterized protein YkwD
MRTRSYLALLLVLGACGGDDGGGGGDDDGDGGGDVPAGAYCDPARAWPASATALEAQIVTLVNQRRAAGATCGGQARPPVPALTANAALRCAARVHTRDMADRDFFDHTNPSGEDPFERMVRAGYEWSNAGENIAGGGATAESTMEQWMGSSGHCNNIMSDSYVDIGVGHVESDRLWTQVFGTPQ